MRTSNLTQAIPTAMARHLRRFARDESAVVAIEAVVMLPMLFWGYVAMFTFFDAYRQTSLNLKAAYTISDMISRETLAVNPAYMNGAHNLLELLTRSADTTRLRVTIARWDNVAKKHFRDWSQTKGGVVALSDAQVQALSAKLPIMVHNERVIIVETWSTYDPPFNVGLEEQALYNFVFTRPRFAPQVVWSNT